MIDAYNDQCAEASLFYWVRHVALHTDPSLSNEGADLRGRAFESVMRFLDTRRRSLRREWKKLR